MFFFSSPREFKLTCDELMDADGWSALGAHGLTFEFATRRPLLASRRRRSRWCPPRRRPTDGRPSRAAGTTSPTWKLTDRNSSGIQLVKTDVRRHRQSPLRRLPMSPAAPALAAAFRPTRRAAGRSDLEFDMKLSSKHKHVTEPIRCIPVTTLTSY